LRKGASDLFRFLSRSPFTFRVKKTQPLFFNRCSAMLATQLNGLVRGGSIDVGTMLRLDDYLVNTLNGRK